MTIPLPSSTPDVVARAYAEDLANIGDLTTLATIPEGHRSRAEFVARSSGCMAGIPLIELCLEYIDPEIVCRPMAQDGELVQAGTVILEASGATRSLLSAERVALNFLGRLSGIATATRAFVDIVAGTGAAISDTRKTTPGLRALEKYSVAVGGGVNHRMGLYDAVLIKDNHLAATESIADAVSKARMLVGPDIVVEVEVDTFDQLAQVLATDADIVLLDNMSPEDLRTAVGIVGAALQTEASGGITLHNVREVAEAGVDVISVGWLTHSAPALDVAMELVREREGLRGEPT
ncbi:MAG: carboxylating nicotinate-nucleotide diphosphorylase [Actinomycetota bacterium]|nr:carboxylating nicotinate-nucleotide diphosphorylase [Actinomycetota bacterium]